MQRKLFAIVLVAVMLLTSASSVFAQGGKGATQPEGWVDYSWVAWPDPAPLADANFICGTWWNNLPIGNGAYWTNWEWVPLDMKLGDILEMAFPVYDVLGIPATFQPVDVYLWRPPTEVLCYDIVNDSTDLYRYWPLVDNPMKVWNFTGSFTDWSNDYDNFAWYLPTGSNPDGPRRQSWPTYQETDAWGFYYARFMLPRDEVWYPCSYPCKWGCNFYLPYADLWEFHSPWLVNDVYPAAVPFTPAWYYPVYFPLYWPWKYWTDGIFDAWVGDLPWTAADEATPYPQFYLFEEDPATTDDDILYYGVLPSVTDPQDTVHPLTVWTVEGTFGSNIQVLPDAGDLVDPIDWGEIEVVGYDWKTTDLEVEWPADYPMECTNQNWYPTWLP